MAIFDYQKKEINLKVVYYGPGLSGKTSNIQYIYEHVRPENKGKLVSLATQTDRTLFFDFLPLELGSLGGYKLRFHLYTVPGQVHYDATRKLVLKGVDGIVFVADSQREMKEANLQSLVNMEKNLLSYGKRLKETPIVLQFNKRDLAGIMTLQELNNLLNRYQVPVVEAVATKGTGVLETLRIISKLVIRTMQDKIAMEGTVSREASRGKAAPPPRPAAPPPIPPPIPTASVEAPLGEEPPTPPPAPTVALGDLEPPRSPLSPPSSGREAVPTAPAPAVVEAPEGKPEGKPPRRPEPAPAPPVPLQDAGREAASSTAAGEEGTLLAPPDQGMRTELDLQLPVPGIGELKIRIALAITVEEVRLLPAAGESVHPAPAAAPGPPRIPTGDWSSRIPAKADIPAPEIPPAPPVPESPLPPPLDLSREARPKPPSTQELPPLRHDFSFDETENAPPAAGGPGGPAPVPAKGIPTPPEKPAPTVEELYNPSFTGELEFSDETAGRADDDKLDGKKGGFFGIFKKKR